MTTNIAERLSSFPSDEAAYHDDLAEEMTALSGDRCGRAFGASLRAVARNHRIRSIELRARIAALKAPLDG